MNQTWQWKFNTQFPPLLNCFYGLRGDEFFRVDACGIVDRWIDKNKSVVIIIPSLSVISQTEPDDPPPSSTAT